MIAVRSNRIIAIVTIAALIALLAAAVALDASASGGPQVDASHLDVGTGLPTSATAVVTLSDSTGVTASADVALDFASGRAEVNATAMLSIATVSLEARILGDRVELNVEQFESLVGAPWVSVRAPNARARQLAIARFFRHPDVALLRVLPGTVTRTVGATTTTTAHLRHVLLPSTSGLPITLPRIASMVVAVTTGSQGQLLALAVHLTGPIDQVQVHAALVVTSYDVPVSVVVPGPDEVVALTAHIARSVFGTSAGTVTRYLKRLGAL